MYGRVEVRSSDVYQVIEDDEPVNTAFVSLEDLFPEPPVRFFCSDHYVTYGDGESCPDCDTAILAVALGLAS